MYSSEHGVRSSLYISMEVEGRGMVCFFSLYIISLYQHSGRGSLHSLHNEMSIGGVWGVDRW
jgi:hypothetical protein